MIVLSTCITKQRGHLVDRNITIRNIGIKMCQVKCVEKGGCLSFEYNFETLTCRLPTGESKKTTEKPWSIFLLKNQSNVLTEVCSSTSCDQGSCLRTRSGKDVCIKGGKQSYPERCPLKKPTKNVKQVDKVFHDACMEGDMCQVKNILSEGKVDINGREGKYNRTPVMEAAYKGHVDGVDFLVSKRCDLSLADANNDNIFHLACDGGDIETVEYILSQGIVDVNSEGYRGRTPLLKAAAGGHREVFDLLVRKGGNLSLVNSYGNTILHMASQGGDITAVKYVLSQNIVDINRGGKHQRTPVLMAAYYGNIEVFDLLVGKGGDVSSVDDTGDNILHAACERGNIAIVKYVLSKDIVDINCRGRNGMTPVLKAALFGHKEVFDLLVGKEGDVSLVDDTGDNILHAACKGGNIEIVKYVLSKDIVDINSRGRQRMACVMKAAYYGHRKVFDLLVGAGGDVSRKGVNSIIRVACRGRHLDMAKYVLSQHGVNTSRKRCRKTL